MNHLIKKIYTLFFAFILVTVTSCTYTFPEPEKLVPGSADFTKLVSVGNSLTAGYMNGAMYNDGQEASFVNIIAEQMKSNGGGEFNQPDIDAPNGIILSLLPNVFGRLILKGELTTAGVINPAPTPIGPGDPLTAYSGDRSALNNFGVPGMRIIHAEIPGYGAGNPYYGRFASSGTSTVLGDATAANGTFFTFWLGNNDVLGYALAGATGAQDGTTGIDMTPIDLFTGAYNSAIAAMTANGASGIIANMPNLPDIAHFTTVAWNVIEFDTSDPVDAGTIAALNASYAVYNGGLDQMAGLNIITVEEAELRKIVFSDGANGIVIFDNTLTDLTGFNPGLVNMRMANPTDLITLTAGAVLGTLADPNNPQSVIGVAVPLDERYTLVATDLAAIDARITAFNAVIKAAADNSGGKIAFLDANAIFADLVQTGVTINGSGLDATLLPPFGAFSLDGVHPNARGAAYVASLFIDKINEAFDANIPNINPNNYKGNELPQPQ